jgi:hypothetical protein
MTDSSAGFVLLSRSLLDSKLWSQSSDLVRLFIYLILKANYSSKDFTYSRGSARITVKKGEFLRSLRWIGEDCAYTGNNKLVVWSSSRISGMLKTLEDDGRIEILSNSSALGTHIRICNYLSYQDFTSYRKEGLGTGPTSPPGEGLRTDAEQTQNKKKQTENKKQTDAMWAVYLEEMSAPPHPKLTEKRRSVLGHLLLEQLSSNGTDPLVLFRKVLKAVKGSSHHMSNRAYQLPESLFRSEERRESWAHRALAKAKADPSTPAVSRDWSVEQ